MNGKCYRAGSLWNELCNAVTLCSTVTSRTFLCKTHLTEYVLMLQIARGFLALTNKLLVLIAKSYCI